MNLSESDITRRINEISNEVNTIEGWLSNQGIENLYTFVLKAPIPNIVEIGSWKGKSTSCLAFAIKDRGEGRVYAVDTCKGSQEQVHL